MIRTTDPSKPHTYGLPISPGAPSERGGLHTLFTMVLGGLVGATPHMISAAVMALVRHGRQAVVMAGRAASPLCRHLELCCWVMPHAISPSHRFAAQHCDSCAAKCCY